MLISEEEIESLEAILMDDVRISRNPETGIAEMVETTVFPIVGENTDQQYVCVTLQVGLVEGYPDVRPTFKLKNPRGLSDSSLNMISRSINAKLDENLGSPVVFDLIDVVREHLTESNLPSGQCVVCLYGFQDEDQFTKTECYHYLHTYCLARHLDASKRNYEEEFAKLQHWQQLTAKPYHAACPVCREAIACDRVAMEMAPPPNELVLAPNFELTEEIRSLQAKMADLYLRQKNRGGIIDVAAEEPQILSIDDGQEAAEREQRNRQRQEAAEADEERRLQEANSAAQLKKAALAAKHKKNSHYQQHHQKNHHNHRGHHHPRGHQHVQGKAHQQSGEADPAPSSGPSNR